MIKVSVIVPIYNVEPYIDKCLDGILNQSCRDIEVLLMVGLCSDHSLEKCVVRQKEDSRIVIVSRKDTSLGDARNYGLKIAKGKYIAYVDADDIVKENYLSEMIWPMEQDPDVDISCCGFDKLGADGACKGGWIPRTHGKKECGFERYIQLVQWVSVWTKVYRRKWLLENGIFMFDGCCEDHAMHYILASKVRNVFFIPSVLYHYNIGNMGSLVHSAKSNTDYGKAIDFAMDYIKKQGIYEQALTAMEWQVISSVFYILGRSGYHKTVIDMSIRLMETYFPGAWKCYRKYWSTPKIKTEPVILFGAGDDLPGLLDKGVFPNVKYIIDNNEKKHGTVIKGIPVCPFEQLTQEKEDLTVVITSSKYERNMMRQLWERDVKNIWTAWDYTNKNLDLSIIIPVYNAGPYLSEALDSILNQTHGNFEVIIVDDGSTDDSKRIEMMYASRDMRIRICETMHEGAGAARNYGMKLARGAYLVFLDADDRFAPDLLERIEHVVTEKNPSIVVWDAVEFDSLTNRRKDSGSFVKREFLGIYDDVSPDSIAGGIFQFTSSTVWNKAFSRKFIAEKDIRFQCINRANDVFFVYMALAEAEKISVMHQVLTFYRTGNIASLQGSRKGRSLDFYKALRQVRETLEERNLLSAYRKSFQNVALEQCLWELFHRKSLEDSEYIFNCYQKYIFRDLGLDHIKCEECYNADFYDLYEAVAKKTYVEYCRDCSERVKAMILKPDWTWKLPAESIPAGARLVLYGAGGMGQDFYKQLVISGHASVSGWVDSAFEKYRKAGMDVKDPSEVLQPGFDWILICVSDAKVRREIADYIEKTFGVDRKKMIYEFE